MFKPLKRFRYYTNLVLPLTYSDALSYMEDMGAVVHKLNDVINNYNELINYYNSLDGIIGEVNNKISELDDAIVKVKKDVADAIESLETEIRNSEEEMTTRIDQLITETVTRIDNLETKLTLVIQEQLEVINKEIILIKNDYGNLEESITGKVDKILSDFIKDLPDVQNVLVRDPVSGKLVTIQYMVDWLLEYMRCEALTAWEYDMLGMTAAEYDNFFIIGWGSGLTAHQYDWYGKTILSKFKRRKYFDALTGQLVTLNNKVDDNTDLIKASGSYTAQEYDALQITAEQYDALQLTAYQYDWHANQSIIKEESNE